MILHNRYLSDEELERLIAEAEADLMPAPPELADNIRDLIQNSASDIKEKRSEPKEIPKTAAIKKNKQKEFAAYCFRVSMAVAASVAFIFIMPYLPGFDMSTGEAESYTDINRWEPEPLSEEQLAEYEALRNCPTREEVLNETNLIEKVFGENGIFTDNIHLNSLKEENGGQ